MTLGQVAQGDVQRCGTFTTMNLAMWPLPNTFETFLYLDREGAAVMVAHSLPLRSCPPLLGKGRDDGHGHTEPSFQRLSSFAGKGKGWWSWPYRAFFSKALLFCWEREGVVVMVIQLSLLERGRGNGHGHTQPSSKKLYSSSWTI